MTTIELKPRAKKLIKSLPPKHKRQVKNYILSLQNKPMPHDAKPLVGYRPYMRGDCGEYRIVYKYEPKADVVIIVLVGKRNGDEVYKIMRRVL